jgi:hypothetical protein
MLVAIVINEKVDMIRCYRISKDHQPVPLFCLEKPMQPTILVASELEQKVTVVTAVSEMPGIPGDMV